MMVYLYNTQNHRVCGLRKSSGILNNWITYSPPLHEEGNRSNFRNVLFSSYLELWTTEKVHTPSNFECYTPSSEPFGF
jgi:hypothetical protein